jgi:porin-like protein
MKIVKSLLLGSTAGLLAMGGAQAADLPVKAKAVEYVKICSLYGAGFYYIPGTDTCIRIGGAIRLDVAFNGNIYDGPFWQANPGAENEWTKNYYQARARYNFTEDTRTATEYGVLRTYANLQFDFSQDRENIAGGFIEVDYAFIQFAGFTMGKAVSEFDPQWALTKPHIGSNYLAGSNNATGIMQFAYTASFGNGVSGTISLEDPTPYRNAGLYNSANALIAPFQSSFLATGYGGAASAANTFLGNSYGGNQIPDIVGNLRLDQAWGTLHFAAAGHNIDGGFYGANQLTGHPNNAYGGAVTGGIELKNLPTGVGDSFKAEATFANGAAKYVFGGTYDTNGGARFAKYDGNGGIAFGYVLDGVFNAGANGGQIAKSNAWEVDASFEHYWNPMWRTSIFGGYSKVGYGDPNNPNSAAGMLLTAYTGGKLSVNGTSGTVLAGTFVCGVGGCGSPDIAVAQLGTKTSWQPVKDLTFSAEFLYSRLYNSLNGTYVGNVAGQPNGATYVLRDQNLYNGAVQVLRSF